MRDAAACRCCCPIPRIATTSNAARAGARRGELCRRSRRRCGRRHALYRRRRRRGADRQLRRAAGRSAIAATPSRTVRRACTAICDPTSPPRSGSAYGDVDAAFADAAHVFERGALAAPRRRHGDRDPRRARAVTIAASDMLTVWSGTQTPHLGRRRLADLLDRDLAIDPHDRARRRRRLRPEGDLLSRGGGDPGGGAEARPAGEMDRGPARAFSVRNAGARPVLGRGDRGRRRRQHPRRARRACCTTPAPSCRGASSCRTSPRRRCRAPMWCRPISSTPRSCSPTRCRPRRCAAPAGRRPCSRWSG